MRRSDEGGALAGDGGDVYSGAREIRTDGSPEDGCPAHPEAGDERGDGGV